MGIRLNTPPFSWDYFPHDHARSRAYRWGEDGLLGITDRQCRLCFGLALWNEKDPILKVGDIIECTSVPILFRNTCRSKSIFTHKV